MVIKPSEVSGATEGLVAELIPKYLSQVRRQTKQSVQRFCCCNGSSSGLWGSDGCRSAPQDCYTVACGGAEETKALLENRFDRIFYTGDALSRLTRSVQERGVLERIRAGPWLLSIWRFRFVGRLSCRTPDPLIRL